MTHQSSGASPLGRGRYLLALRVVILDQVLEEVHAFFGLDLVDFDQVLRKKQRGAACQGGTVRADS